MAYVIETSNITKIYNKKKVIDNVSMHVEEGSVYGFVGENGAGKTTIMRLIMGLSNLNGGSYKIFDAENKSKKIYQARKQVSAIIEAPSLVGGMTAKQNLMYAGYYYNIKDFSIIDEILKTVGLSDTGNKKVKNFSLGMRQRLGIAVLLLNNPKLLLLDEPLNGLDPTGIAEVREIIKDLNRKGITIVISSHILSELEKVATHYGFISHGKLVKEASAEDLARECQHYTEIKHKDLDLIENALRRMGYTDIERNVTSVKLIDDVLPYKLLSQFEKMNITITDIKSGEGSVEDYYLQLIGGVHND